MRLLDVLDPTLEQLNDSRALRKQNGKSLPDAIDRGEEAEIAPEFIMVALEGFRLLGQVLVEFLLGGERHAVDSLEHLILLVALPVCARALREFERLDKPCGEEVRSCAEVDEFALSVEADDLSLGQFVDQLNLIRLVPLGHEFNRLGAGQFEALDLQVFLDDFLHLGFEFGKDFGGKGDIRVDVIIEAVIHCRTDGEFCFGVQAFDCLRQNMRRGMAEEVFARFVRKCEQPDALALVNLGRERDGFPFDLRADDASVNQPCFLCRVVNRCGRGHFNFFSLHFDFHCIFLL